MLSHSGAVTIRPVRVDRQLGCVGPPYSPHTRLLLYLHSTVINGRTLLRLEPAQFPSPSPVCPLATNIQIQIQIRFATRDSRQPRLDYLASCRLTVKPQRLNFQQPIDYLWRGQSALDDGCNGQTGCVGPPLQAEPLGH
jgi:hypothetical protein